MNEAADQIREAFRVQAEYCDRLGSPLTALVCRVTGVNITPDNAVGAKILNWQGKPDALNDSVPLRFAAALHALVRGGRHPSLAALYPPNPVPKAHTLWREIETALTRDEAHILKWLTLPPQTNEVARSAVLMSGLLVIAAETNLPLELYEAGASAGLNLMLDQYAYRLGDTEAGRQDSALRLSPQWKGASPPKADIRVSHRQGVDISPLDISAALGRERLTAYIWADQPERIARAEAAMGIAVKQPPQIDKEDAADWVERVIAADPKPGVARVLMHSVAYQYFPSESRKRIAAHANEIGRKATVSAPFAWLRMEVAEDGSFNLTLTLWSNGEERVLAKVHPHGQWVEWLRMPE